MVPVRVKICSLTRTEDAALALELGAWALGLFFAPESPRRLDLKRAAEVLAPSGGRRTWRRGVDGSGASGVMPGRSVPWSA